MNLAIHHAHGWAVTPAAAVTRQRQLAPLVREEPLFAPPQSIAGVDMSVRGDQVQAAVVLLSYPALTVLEQAIWQGQVEFPYVSVGHRITLPETIELTLACTTRYRLPEPTRQAHLFSKKQ